MTCHVSDRVSSDNFLSIITRDLHHIRVTNGLFIDGKSPLNSAFQGYRTQGAGFQQQIIQLIIDGTGKEKSDHQVKTLVSGQSTYE